MTVLIVDDEAYMVTYIKNLVNWEEYGFDRQLTANGGSLARDLIREYQPELLITDIKMPKTSGLDLAKFISENNYATKIIILSGYSDFQYAKQALRYGVSEYLVKPLLKKDFIETLDRIAGSLAPKAENGKNPVGEAGNKGIIIAEVKNYINENYNGDLSLQALGEMIHLHPAYLSKIFKEYTGMAISGYITDIRMQKAAWFLEKTQMKIHEVMKQVGYQKSQYFSRIFKEKYGVTPKEYRWMKWKGNTYG